jgi:probable HAF family extracellular repeat protein
MAASKYRAFAPTRIIGGVLVAGLSLLSAAAIAQTVYTIDDLGVLPGDNTSVAQGINENGDVVGWSNGPGGARPFLYTGSTGMVALAPFPGGSPNGVARDINDAGEVVGQLSIPPAGPPHAVRWTGGVPEDLGAIPDTQFSEGMGINAASHVTGDNGNSMIEAQAFIYLDPGPMEEIPLPASRARGRDINNNGQLTGYMTGAAHRAFRWSETGGVEDLGVAGGLAHSFGFAINDVGQVVGTLTSATGNTEHVFRYTDGIGMEDLGGFGEVNAALGINNHGDFVGHGRPTPSGLKRAFIYVDPSSPLASVAGLPIGLQDVNGLLDPALNWFVLYGYDINDAGEIAGHAINNDTSEVHAVRLRLTGGIQPPDPPSDLVADAVNANWINVSWIDHSDNESGFSLERRPAGGAFTIVATPGKNVLSFIDATVLGGTTYDYRIKAVNPAGTSAYSNSASATTPVEDLEPPTVNLIRPSAGAEVSGRVAIEIDAADKVGVALVRFYVDNALACESASSPLTCKWNTRKLPLGDYFLRAQAADAAGNVSVHDIAVTLVAGGGGGGGGGGGSGGEGGSGGGPDCKKKPDHPKC